MLAALLACASGLARSARAYDEADDDPQTRSSIGPRSVLYKPIDADGSPRGAGLQARVRMRGGYSLEASVDAVHYTSGGTRMRDVPAQVTLIGYSLMPGSPLSFYGLLGYGWYFRRVEGAAPHHETLTHPHVGAGLQLLIGWHLALDLDYRYLFGAVWRFNDWTHPWGSGYKRRGSMATLSLNYCF